MATIKKRTIKILSHEKIDAQKWNHTVQLNYGLVYNLYEYLTALAENWSSIIVGDYECIIAIPWRKKWGIRYVYSVPFLQQLSILGQYHQEEHLDILTLFQQYIKYGDYSLTDPILSNEQTVSIRTNYYVPLQASHDKIFDLYRINLKQRIRKAKKYGLVFNIGNMVSISDKNGEIYNSWIKNTNAIDLDRFLALCNHPFLGSFFRLFSATYENKEVAICMILQYENRLYNLLSWSSTDGRRFAAMHFLLDKIIEEYAGSDFIFDFEGSDLPGVKSFYQQFSPIASSYYQYHLNHLCFPLRLFKR